jgi:hypothetical protein
MKSFRFKPEDLVLGSALRRAAPRLSAEVRYDPLRAAAMNDLVFGEIVKVPSPALGRTRPNWLERLYLHGDGIKLANERMPLAPCIGVIGNRYAPPYLIGGFTHPITGASNGEIRGGSVADGLFGINAIGYVDHAAFPDQRASIKIHGVLVDGLGRSINLSRFREALDAGTAPYPSHTCLIVVAGHSTDAGKTTCAWALATELRKQGLLVTMEKKTGTACCRDWLRCHSAPETGVLEKTGDEFSFAPDSFPARDFVDALGVVSDVTIETASFVAESVRYTKAFLSRWRPDFHIVELADSISHASNTALLRARYFQDHIDALVYACVPTHEAAAHLMAYVRSLGYRRTPVLLSGPLANEPRYDMARAEIRARLGIPVCRSAVEHDGRWIAEGGELAGEVLRHRRQRARRLRVEFK